MHVHQVSPFGIVHPIEMGGFTSGYRSEGTRGRQVIIVKGSSVIGSLISLSSSLALDFFFGWSIDLFIWWRGTSQLLASRILELLLELINLPLELEVLELGGELQHMGVPWSSIIGGGLSTGGITLRWRSRWRYLIHTVPSLRHSLSKRLSSSTESLAQIPIECCLVGGGGGE
jgi:hypothetical protein